MTITSSFFSLFAFLFLSHCITQYLFRAIIFFFLLNLDRWRLILFSIIIDIYFKNIYMNNLKWYAHILAHIQLKWRERQRMSHIFVASLWRAVLSCLLSMPCAVYSLCAICALHFEYHFFDFFGCCLHSNSYRRRKALTFHQYRPLCWCTVQIYLYFCVFFFVSLLLFFYPHY